MLVKSPNRIRSGHRASGAAGVAQAPRHPVDELDEGRVDLRGRAPTPTQGALRADRLASATGLHRPRIEVVRERVEVPAGRLAEPAHERVVGLPRDLTDGADAPGVQLLRGDRADAPEALDGKRVQERELAVGRARRGARRAWRPRSATFARNFVRATPTVIGSPTRSATSRRSRCPICSGVPAMRRSPPTSRNASSTESPSTRGVVSSKTSNTARLASEYADMRGSTTTASGQSRSACRQFIGVRTPRAFAS